MRILVTVDPEIPVPPEKYGGVERLVEGLLKYYSEKGHQVRLVANSGSTSQWPEQIYAWPANQSRGIRNSWSNAWFLLKCIRGFKPNAVHSFSRLLYMYPTFIFKPTFFLQTYGRQISWKSTLLASTIAGRKLHFTCCGKHMVHSKLKRKHKFTPVHNFTLPELFPLKSGADYMVFLGRIEDIKGTKEAIAVAKATGNNLVIAGNIQPGHEGYFEQEVQPWVDEDCIKYLGPVNDEQKKALFSKAKLFLFPIKWEEPFGMVMVEAMAAGVPVYAFGRGAVPEVVEEGVSGRIAGDLDELIAVVKNFDQENWSPQIIREQVVRNFSLEVIGEQYLSLLACGEK
ncbi:MAG: glycosyltransferase involved in cell wall biosynthesis [Sphingobacteriales bacterium]|jgi:glycosyltransferase involved in cell wall biosynthesis